MENQDQILIVQARITRAFIRALGMDAENKQRIITDAIIAYSERHFRNLIEEEGIGEREMRELLGWE